MLREIKTTLLGTDSRTDEGWPADREDAPETRVIRDAAPGDATEPARPPRSDGTDQDRPELRLDRVLELVSEERRRLALTCLDGRAQPVSTDELADRVAVWECETESPTSAERDRVHVNLHHCHLPKLAAASVVAFDPERGTVERGPRFAQFTDYLDDEA